MSPERWTYPGLTTPQLEAIETQICARVPLTQIAEETGLPPLVLKQIRGFTTCVPNLSVDRLVLAHAADAAEQSTRITRCQRNLRDATHRAETCEDELGREEQ